MCPLSVLYWRNVCSLIVCWMMSPCGKTEFVQSDADLPFPGSFILARPPLQGAVMEKTASVACSSRIREWQTTFNTLFRDLLCYLFIQTCRQKAWGGGGYVGVGPIWGSQGFLTLCCDWGKSVKWWVSLCWGCCWTPAQPAGDGLQRGRGSLKLCQGFSRTFVSVAVIQHLQIDSSDKSL